MTQTTETILAAGAVLVAALLAVGEDSRQEWKLKRGDTNDMVHFTVKRSQPGSHWSYSSDVPLVRFHGLSMEAFDRSGATKFEYVADAGRLVCQGSFSWGRGSGSFTAVPNPEFVAELKRLGYAAPDESQVFSMMMSNVSLEFARGVKEAGLNATTGELIELRVHDITLEYIQEVRKAGYRSFTARDYVSLHIHGVTPEFTADLQRAGYDLSAGQITELHIHGIDSSYVRELERYLLKPRASELVELKIHGVTPDYLKGLKDAGYGGLTAGEITQLKIHGLSTRFIQEARASGYNFTPEDLIELQIHGVSGSYLNKLRDAGMRNLTASEITKLKIHGVE